MSSRALACLLLLVLGGCDTFFGIRGRITRCADDMPIVGARVTLALGDGISSDEVTVVYSSPNGDYWAELNEPPTVSATLTIDKPGYEPLVEDFDEAPEDDQNRCLVPQEQ